MLVGCAPQASTEKHDVTRPVTTEESQLLAIARFNNFDAGSRPFTTNLQERGVDLRLRGWVDYVGHLGYASTTGAFVPQAMVWTLSTGGIIEREPDSTGNPVLPIPASDNPALTIAALDASTSRLDALLSVISSLGADRPDNPLLLQLSGAHQSPSSQRLRTIPLEISHLPSSPRRPPRFASGWMKMACYCELKRVLAATGASSISRTNLGQNSHCPLRINHDPCKQWDHS